MNGCKIAEIFYKTSVKNVAQFNGHKSDNYGPLDKVTSTTLGNLAQGSSH